MNRTQPRSTRRSHLAILAALALLTPPAATAAADPAPLARVSHQPSLLIFEPLVGAARWQLTLTGPGELERVWVFEGAVPGLSVFDEELGILPDGAYEWRLVAVPAAPVADPRKTDSGRGRGVTRRGRAAAATPRPAQSGEFAIVGGLIVDPERREPEPAARRSPPPASQGPAPNSLITGNLSVNDNLCVGADCVDPESPGFGSDTVRIKAKNTQVKFYDTSGAGFATRDWMLQTNSSAPGGASFFAVSDCGDTSANNASCGGTVILRLDAGAPADSLRVDASGNLGVRRSPVMDLHVVDGDSPTLRLEQDVSSGFTKQIWDLGGNEENLFVKDVTAGSRLPLRIRPGAPTSSIDVAASGNVGLGIGAPGASLHVRRTNGTASVLVEETSGTPAGRTLAKLSNNGSAAMELVDTRVLGAGFTTWKYQTLRGGACPPGQLCFATTLDGSGATEMVLDERGNLKLRGDLTACTDPGVCSPTDTFPDYVFEPGYELLTLAELAVFVERERHLPGMPTLAEVETGGLNMTAMQMKLLEKVEELTLYTLAQEERLRAYREDAELRLERLEAERARLLERVAGLEARAAAR